MGTIRRIDDLGRIAIPKEWRKRLGALTNQAFDMKFEGRIITLQLAKDQCHMCGIDYGELTAIGERHLCGSCLKELREAADREV